LATCSASVGQVRLGDAILEAVEIALVAVVLAQLFLDGLELLAKDVFALVFAHLLFDLRVDPLAHLEDLELPREEAQDLADALLGVDRLDELGLLLHGGVEVRRDEVGERAGRLDGVDERAGLPRELRHELDDLLRDVAQAHREGLCLDVFGLRLVEALHLGLHVRRGLRDRVEPDARETLEDQGVVARRVLERLEHARRAADGVEVFLSGIVRRRIALGEDGDHRPGEVVDVLDEGDGLLATHVERRNRPGEQDRVADREHGELIAERDVFGRSLWGFLLGHLSFLSWEAEGSGLGGGATTTTTPSGSKGLSGRAAAEKQAMLAGDET
jgi:hypothetical protein